MRARPPIPQLQTMIAIGTGLWPPSMPTTARRNCPFSGRPWSDCSRSCPHLRTASPEPSGEPFRRSAQMHARRSRRSLPPNDSRMRRSSAMHGSIARSRRSAAAASGSSKRRRRTATRTPPLGDGHGFARLSLRLTAEGEQVLRGESDRVDLLGVDRWIGGTHVTPENAWRWDPAARRLLARWREYRRRPRAQTRSGSHRWRGRT